MELEPSRGAARRARPAAADGRARSRARVPADAAAASGRNRPRAVAGGGVRARRAALFPGHAPQPGRARLPRLLRRNRSVRRLGASNDERGRAARGLPLHRAGRARRPGSAPARRQPGDGRRRGVARHDLSDARRPRPRGRPADLRARAGRPAEAERAACVRPRCSWARPSSCSRSSPRAPVPSPSRSSWTGRTGISRRRRARASASRTCGRPTTAGSASRRNGRVSSPCAGRLARSTGERRRWTPSSRTTGAKSSSRSTRSRSRSATRIWTPCTTRRCCPTPRSTRTTGARRRFTWRRSATPTW